MRILISGGGGFIGQHVAREARASGHDVTCTTRQQTSATENAKGSWMTADLATDRLDLTGFEAVIHCAASLAGGAEEQKRDTVLATERLAAAAQKAGVRRFVLLSTFAVYDTTRLASGSVLDETTPRTTGAGQHPYIAAKRRQEDLIQKHFEDRATILRPGLVYGPERTWFHHLGMQRGTRWIILAGRGLLPIVHVASCARAAVLSAATGIGAETLNLIDDNLPTRSAYAEKLASLETSTGNPVPRPGTSLGSTESCRLLHQPAQQPPRRASSHPGTHQPS